MNTFPKILIANRGEIVARVAKTCAKMGIKSVSVFSDADADHPFTRTTDETFALGGRSAAESYLSIEKILDIAEQAGAQAIHPGYGFLSENPEFARQIAARGLTFIGPSPETLELVGRKDSAKQIAKRAKAPIVPGYDGEDQSPEVLKTEAERLGFPLMIKAAQGGGGKGMRRVLAAGEFEQALSAAIGEGQRSFGNGSVILESLVEPARHVEVQLVGDLHGNVLHFFERDCSLQRRHQKVIEECPAPALSKKLREQILKTAVKLGKAISLSNAATVEFLVSLEKEEFYFLEVNPRLQVEHPVTEMLTAVDLVELQIRSAAGEELPLSQKEITANGAAIEARVYAEMPYADFRPATGRVSALSIPEDISEHYRVDHALAAGMTVTADYDPMLGKAICWGETREEARKNLVTLLSGMAIGGVEANISFLISLLEHKDVIEENLRTSFLDQKLESFVENFEPEKTARAAAVAILLELLYSPSQQSDPFAYLSFFGRSISKNSIAKDKAQDRVQDRAEDRAQEVSFKIKIPAFSFATDVTLSISKNDASDQSRETYAAVSLSCNGEPLLVSPPIPQLSPEVVSFELNGSPWEFRRPFRSKRTWDQTALLWEKGLQIQVSRQRFDSDPAQEEESSANLIRSPLPGSIIAVKVKPGEEVEKGSTLLVLESMKMEHQIQSPRPCTIAEIHISPQDNISEGQLLLTLTSPQSP